MPIRVDRQLLARVRFALLIANLMSSLSHFFSFQGSDDNSVDRYGQ